MKKLILGFLLLSFAFTLFAQEKLVVRFTNPDQATIAEFTKGGHDVAAMKPGEFLDIVIPELDYDRMIAEGYDITIVNSTSQMMANLGNVDDINGYRTYQEALDELQQIAADHPDICQLMDIGDSRGKEYFNSGYGNYGDYQHDIWALKVSDNVAVNEDEPAVYYFGAHHAREPLSTEVAFYVLNHIVDNYGSDPEITENVNNKEIWFVPIVNPDGHEVVLDQINTDWRKNIRDNDGNGSLTNGSYYYPDGVDPNRNYGWQWGTSGTSSDPNDITYCGPTPFSEPELQAVRDLMAAHHFVAGISYHTYSELVLWPYGYSSSATPPDLAALADLGTMVGEAIPGLYGGHYTPQASWALYPSSGGTDDWAYGNHGIFGYTVELATEFIPPANEVYQVSEDNLEGAMILLNRINYSTLTGHVTNAATGDPVVAEIFVHEIDNSGAFREPYKSNEAFGSYYRMLMDGSYQVTISAFGYLTQTFDNVEITDEGQTILNVQLEQSEIIALSGTITDADSGEPIQGAMVEALNTPIDAVYTDENGQYQIAEIFENTYTFKVYAEDYATLIQVVSIDPDNNVADFELMESFAISFEAGVFEPGFTFSGDSDWQIDNSNGWDGSASAKSGGIGDESTSEMIYTLEDGMAGQISFYRKVSSESGYDYLQFYIDNQEQDQWAGDQDWEEFIYTVTEGTHTFRWVYEKDYSATGGSDCGWIDYITFPPSAGVNAQAGSNAQLCANETYQCQGEATYYESVEWTTDGDGTFTNSTILDPVYTPGSLDIENGTVELTLTAFDNGGDENSDELTLTLNPLPAAGGQIDGPAQVCAGNAEYYTCPDIENADDCQWVLEPEEAGSIEVTAPNEILVSWTDGYFALASLQVRGINDCGYGEFSDEFVVSVEDCTGIDDHSNAVFSIYPNPAKNEIALQFADALLAKSDIVIYNLLGNKILQYRGNGNTNFVIDISELTEGLYFVAIKGEGQQKLKKLIISR